MTKRGRPPNAEQKVKMTLGLRPELARRLREYAESFLPIRVDRTAVVEAAVEEFLDRHEPKKKERGQ